MEREILQHKLNMAREVHANISTPGWINTKAPKATKLRLDGDVMEMSRNYAGVNKGIGVKGIKQNLERVIPKIEEELSKLAVKTTAITAVPPREVSLRSQDTLANRIIALVPEEIVHLWSETRQLSSEEYRSQATELARFVDAMQSGEIPTVQSFDILRSSQAQKPAITQDSLRQALARLLARNPGSPIENYKYLWGREMRALIDWLGRDAKDLLIQAIDNLPEVERALVLSVSSMSLLKDLDYIDLDECGERRMAAYISMATNILDPDEQDDVLEETITTAAERSIDGSLDTSHVIQLLSQLKKRDKIFEMLLDSAKFRRFRTHLMVFFASDTSTLLLSREAEESMFSDTTDETLPERRIKQ